MIESLREKLLPQGSLREKLANIVAPIGTFAVGAATRSTGLMANAIGSDPVQKPEEDAINNAHESAGQIEANRKLGYHSDPVGNVTTRMSREEREQLAKEFPDAAKELLDDGDAPAPTAEPPADKPSLLDKVADKLKDAFSNSVEYKKEEPVAEPAVAEPTVEQPVTKPTAFDKTHLVFREATAGDGIPFVRLPDGDKSIKDVAPTFPDQPSQPIKALTITDETGSTTKITDPDRVSVANQIAAVANAVAPEYTNYLIKLALREGELKADAFRPESENPGGGDDRGVFQINSKAFPSITKEMADDVKFATLWAISLIESAQPTTGDGRREGQEKWYSNDWAKAAQLVLE